MPFEIASYVAPSSLNQLWQQLAPEGPTPVLLSGGLDLLQAHANDVPDHRTWIDLTRIPELCGIKQIEDGLWIGASTTCTQLANNPLLQTHATALTMAAQQVGAWQRRNSSTLGGYAASGAEADIAPSLYALDACIICNDGRSERQLSCEEFYLGGVKTALHEREIITGFLLPKQERYSIYLKLKEHTARSAAKVSTAISLRIHNEQYTQARIALGGVSTTTLRATTAEGLLEGQPISYTPLLHRVADEVRSTGLPVTDARSTARYRKWSIGILVIRALQQIIQPHSTHTKPTEQTTSTDSIQPSPSPNTAGDIS